MATRGPRKNRCWVCNVLLTQTNRVAANEVVPEEVCISCDSRITHVVRRLLAKPPLREMVDRATLGLLDQMNQVEDAVKGRNLAPWASTADRVRQVISTLEREAKR